MDFLKNVAWSKLQRQRSSQTSTVTSGLCSIAWWRSGWTTFWGQYQ